MFTLNCKGKLISLESPQVMGIINITPDSFYSGSRHQGMDNILAIAEKMIEDGADILDIGGQSTRPGSEALSEEEELSRVIPAIEWIAKENPEAIISIDSFYAKVALEAVNAGASIVNDISAGTLDSRMISMVASLDAPYIMMHMKGNPQNMQSFAVYENLLREILDFFIERKKLCLVAGIKDIIIDPGFGFSKTIHNNLELLRNLEIFRMLDSPILVGLSRKATIYKTLDNSPEQALNGTTAMNTMALMNGASILRVHDVKEAKEVVKLWMAVKGS
jgi:dihydropteroate synthase